MITFVKMSIGVIFYVKIDNEVVKCELFPLKLYNVLEFGSQNGSKLYDMKTNSRQSMLNFAGIKIRYNGCQRYSLVFDFVVVFKSKNPHDKCGYFCELIG